MHAVQSHAKCTTVYGRIFDQMELEIYLLVEKIKLNAELAAPR